MSLVFCLLVLLFFSFLSQERVIDGSTARVISMLAAFKRVISDYQTPESCDLHRDLAEKLVSNMSYLLACRPQNIAMDNAIR